jgi:chromosome segregation ATPase
MTPYHLKAQLNQDSSEDREDFAQALSNASPSPSARVFQGTKPALRNWRISSERQAQNSGIDTNDQDDDLFGSPQSRATARASAPVTTPATLKIAHAVGAFVTIAWLVYSVSYLFKLQGGIASVLSSPFTFGGIVAAILAPVAIIWLVLASWQRRSDATLYAEALRGELQRLLFPTQDQAHQINADIQLLVSQAVEMSSSSRAAIKAIQRARQGLRSEIRDFAGVSQKTEFHIDRLSETLNARAEQLLSLTQKIEERTKNIQDGSSEGVARWTEATNDILQKANQTSAEVDSVADKIAKAQASLTSQASFLSEAGSRIANESQNFENTIAQNINRFEQLTERSKESLSSVTTLIASQEETLNNLVERNANVHEKITTQSEVLNKAVAELSSKTSDLDSVGQNASHKLGEALSMALSGSDAITNAVRKTREQIERSVTEANQSSETMVKQAEQKIQSMIDGVSGQFARLESMMASLESRENSLREFMESLTERNQDLVAVTDTSVAKLDIASERLQGATSNLTQKISEPMAVVDTMANLLTSRAAEAQKIITERMGDVERVSETMVSNAQNIAERMKVEAQNISNTTGHLLAHAKSLDTGLDDHKAKFTEFVDTTENRMDVIQSRVRDQSAQLSALVLRTTGDLENIVALLNKSGDDSLDKSRKAIDDMRVLEQSVLEQLLALAAQSAQTQITLQNMELTLKDTAKSTMPILEDAITKADVAQMRLASLRGNYEDTSNVILGRFDAVNAALDSRLENLNEQSQNVARNLTGLTNDLTQTVERVETTANQADKTLSNLQSGLKDQADHMHLLTDQVRLKVEAMQRIFGLSTDDIGQSVGKALAQLEDVTSKFSRTADLISERADQSSDRVSDVTKRYHDEAQRLLNVSEDQVQKSIRLLSDIKDHSLSMSDQSKQTLLDLQRANDAIAIRVREVDEYMKASLRNTQTYNDDLKAQAQLVARVSGETVDVMADQISKLSLKADEARNIGQSLIQSLDVSQAKISDETERLNSVARKAVDTAEDAAGAFARQSVTLYKAVQDVATYAERVKETQLRTQRDAFLSSAKFVVESLHSLAVDVARHLETDVDERIWKQYQKGDMSSFTKRLMELSAGIDMPRAQRKFSEDGEFRNYVQRYIRQFEELFAQAQSNDHGDLLATTFSTSQIGRVYALLCDISGRNSKLN